MTDLYVQNPQTLLGQPKATIGNYVEQNGILVPRRFASLDEALDSGVPFIMRSEHQDEYAGAAGLLQSFVITKDEIEVGKRLVKEYGDKEWSPTTLIHHSLKMARAFVKVEQAPQVEVERELAEIRKDEIDSYCRILNLDNEEFRQGISFSYWEYLGGFNRSIVVDSSVPGRYHIITLDTKTNNNQYVCFEDGELTPASEKLPSILNKKIGEVIEFYERIRHLGNFDPTHCPVVEFQTVNGVNYFLQYHRTRDFSPSTFTISREREEDEFETDFVRGATPEEGIVSKVSYFYPKLELKDVDGAYGFHTNSAFGEIRSRMLNLQLFSNPFYHLIHTSTQGHVTLSGLFNPRVSLRINSLDDFVSQEERLKVEKESIRTGTPSTFSVRVISDGRRAYVKKV